MQRKPKRFTNYVPEDFEQRVPFLVRKIEVEEEEEEKKGEPQEDEIEDTLAEAVIIHWTRKGVSEEELVPYVEEEEEEEENLEELTGNTRKLSESTVEESESLQSYVPEPDPEPDPEIVAEPEIQPVEKKSKKKKDKEKVPESVIELQEEPPAVMEVELEERLDEESLGEADTTMPVSEMDSKWEAESEIAEISERNSLFTSEMEPETKVESIDFEEETLPKWDLESIEKSAVESATEWETKSAGRESGELVVETEEIELQMVDPKKEEEGDEVDETSPSYTWLLGPTSDEVILDAVEFICHILSFVQDPIGFQYQNRECCKKSKFQLTESGDGTESEEDFH